MPGSESEPETGVTRLESGVAFESAHVSSDGRLTIEGTTDQYRRARLFIENTVRDLETDDPGPAPGERLIPEGSVWKFVFEVSHAPHYVREFDNGAFASIYAPVERIDGDPAVPFGLSREAVREKKALDHVTVIEVPIEESPWAEGTYL